jgi:tetratricopeptide (TPR) repeat protein
LGVSPFDGGVSGFDDSVGGKTQPSWEAGTELFLQDVTENEPDGETMPRCVRARTWFLAAAVQLALGANPCLAQVGIVIGPSEQSYELAVERYASGDRARAVSQLLAWSQDELWPVVRKSHRRFRAAEITLHTDLAVGEFFKAGADHEAFEARVEEIEKLLLTDRVDRFFRARWRLSIGLLFLKLSSASSARRHFMQGLAVVDDDPELLVALGASFELSAATVHGSSGDAERVGQNRFLSWAAARYERVLDQDPSHAEANLRLAHVSFALGRRAAGESHLSWTLDHADDPGLLYVAHLLAGREHERGGRYHEAAASYVRANQIDPKGCVGFIALSHVLSVLGDQERARSILKGALDTRGSSYADAWQGYYQGRDSLLSAHLAELLSAAGQP